MKSKNNRNKLLPNLETHDFLFRNRNDKLNRTLNFTILQQVQNSVMKKILILFAFLSGPKLIAQNTWNEKVSCILYTHCASCHNPNGIGPGDFTQYQNVVNYAPVILNAIQNKRMPPYPPTEYQRYADERKLSQDEINTIASWVGNATPQGPAPSPIAPYFAFGATMQNPDLVISMPTYTVNSLGGDLYRCFPIPVNLSSDKYAVEIEVVPGNRKIVHHVLVFQDSTNMPILLDNADPGPGYSSGGTGSNASILFSAWVPGQTPQKFVTNFGMRLKGTTNMVLQVHYPGGLQNEVDSTKVYIKFTNTTVRNLNLSPLLNHGPTLQNGPLSINANQVKTFHSKFTVPIDATIFAVSPHMHKVGINFLSFAVTPLNDTIPFINIPKWDFNWQGSYNLRKGIKIPAGSKLHAFATYDNTTANVNNPHNPPILVTKGESTSDEMLLEYFTYTSYQPGDENIIIDTNNTPDYFNFCNKPLNIENLELDIAISPNPSNGMFYVTPNYQGSISIYSLSGIPIIENSKDHQIDLINYSNGFYFAVLKKASGEKITLKLIKK
jgi:Secretion system C-terminal sorting domain/Copper type II ascorbate-dependent monooxygenase, C-terminal domain